MKNSTAFFHPLFFRFYIQRRYLLILISTFLTIPLTVSASDNPDAKRLELPFYLIDYPDNFEHAYYAPSMNQSYFLTKNIAQIGHAAIYDSMDSFLLASLATAVYDFGLLYLPFGYSWVHEEWHRAVLAHNDVGSRNQQYDEPPFSDSISVYHVKDEDLTRMKKESNPDKVRIASSGCEAQLNLSLTMRKENFFQDRPGYYDRFSQFLNILMSNLYIGADASESKDEWVDEVNKTEITIEGRDVSGPDYHTWVYDLFRPNEPYESRGVHPSGIGIDRYIKYSDLTTEEKEYLDLQKDLSVFNFFSPQLFGFDFFTIGSPFDNRQVKWNVALMHFFTSFGYTLDGNLLIKQGDYNFAIKQHNYHNHERSFPGLEFEVVRLPVQVTNGLKTFLTSSIALWLQPKNQLFYTTDASPGGMFSLKSSTPIHEDFELFIQGAVKTEGWVAGVVQLDEAIMASADISWML